MIDWIESIDGSDRRSKFTIQPNSAGMTTDHTIQLDETIDVARPLHEVFAYIAEFSRIEEWDPAVARGVRLNTGPLGVGSEFRIDMKAGFSLRYTVVEWEPDRRLLMTVDSRPFTAREEIFFTRTAAGTRVRYLARFDFVAPLARLAKRFPGIMDRVGKSAMAGMRRALEDRYDPPRAAWQDELADRLLLPGMLRFTRLGYRGSRRHWNPVSAYLRDRHILITGATSGLGLATAGILAGRGARLTLVARDAGKGESVAEELRRRYGNDQIRVEIADLSLLRDVEALASRLLARGEPIDVLVNNAGALVNPRRETAEGIEQSFALLLLSPYVLTERLQPLLTQAVAARGPARVVNVLSGGMYTQKIQVDDLQSQSGSYSGAVAYARAKRGLMILTEEWARRWAQDGIVVNAMHPGWADTPGVVTSLPEFHRITGRVLRTPEEGADTIVWLAAATEAGKVSGEFWLDRRPHLKYVLPGTRETPAERSRLLEALAATAAKVTSGRARRARRS
ncbi:MAG: SDR family NAD(P)-dependent oxidoreductase [Steroidobacteraceae bacterium]|nr:SDR family NAD(P)-dependent oxidoreductase [Steroidobacteraceae bacterium]